MGNLVFQATLGGQVNLVGPNTASTYNINVPTVNATLATTDANTFTAAQTISSGNLIFSGTGQKVTGDFSNATLTSRAAFQSSTSNGSTGIYALPNGTSTAASWQATNAADPTNASKILIATNGSTDVQLVSGINGTGTYLPLTFYTNGAEKMRLDTSGNLGLGVTPSATPTGVKSINVGAQGYVFSDGVTYKYNSGITNNAYVNGNNSYAAITSRGASIFELNGDTFIWKQASTGTAGSTLSLTSAMTLDASGNLLVGSTSGAARLYLKQSDGTASSGIKVVRYNNDNQYLSLWATGGARYIDSVGDSSVSSELVFRRSIDSGSNFTESARIDSSGNFLVGKTNSTGVNAGATLTPTGGFTLTRTGTSSSDQVVFHRGTAGSEVYVGTITTTGSATSYVTSSDYRLKENIAPMTGALAKVAALNPCTYTWKSTGEAGQGFIAHELQAVVPDAVVGEKDAVDADGNPKYQGIDTSFLVATLTAAIQELKAEFDAYKASHP